MCYDLADVKWPASMSRISDSAFWNCNDLRSIELPEGVVTIGEGAFGACHNLERIELPASLQLVESSAFSGCYNLAYVCYNETEDAAFYLQIDADNAYLVDAEWRYKVPNPIEQLTNVLYLPDGVTIIDSKAFIGTAAQAVVIPDGALTIQSRAFADCPALQYVSIPESITGIADDAFEGSNITIVCTEGGSVETWAIAHEIACIYEE